MLDARRLKVLHEVAARGSFSGAAESLMLSQSAVSQHIAALEGEVGLSLVERGTRPVQLTEAGFSLARHAAGILNRLDVAEQEMAELVDRRQARLRFGCFPTVLGTLMPAAFTTFRRSHPDVRLTIVDDHLHRLLPRLQSGELDVAVIYEHEALPDVAALELERTPLLDDRFQAVVPAGHRLARRRTLRLQDLAEETWIGGAPASAWYRIVRYACRQVGFTPKAGFASDDYIAVQALVAAGLGVSVIPGLAVMYPHRESRSVRSPRERRCAASLLPARSTATEALR